jgi:hypothetical protein
MSLSKGNSSTYNTKIGTNKSQGNKTEPLPALAVK